MNESLLTKLVPALDLAVFMRNADGSFTALASPPSWFPRLADATFPFLGHILDEAKEFWRSGATGSREFGPCAETDESGREFHYRVKAVTLGESFAQFLVFELDPGSDRLREALQKAREQALAAEHRAAPHRRAAAEIQHAGLELHALIEQLSKLRANDVREHLMRAVQAKCEALLNSTRVLTENAQPER